MIGHEFGNCLKDTLRRQYPINFIVATTDCFNSPLAITFCLRYTCVQIVRVDSTDKGRDAFGCSTVALPTGLVRSMTSLIHSAVSKRLILVRLTSLIAIKSSSTSQSNKARVWVTTTTGEISPRA